MLPSKIFSLYSTQKKVEWSFISFYFLGGSSKAGFFYIEKDFSKKIDLNVNKLTRWKKFTFPKFKQYLEQKMVFALINLFPAWFKTFHVSKTSTGEKHLWIYDFHLLSKMLYSIGFRDIVKLTATESTDQGFPIYPLDIDQEGKSRKGSESMYIEARKPEYF